MAPTVSPAIVATADDSIVKNDADVLSGGAGNDNHFYSHPGNIFYNEQMTRYQDAFNQADTTTQNQIIIEIISSITARSGRFLTLEFRQDYGLWLWRRVQGELLNFVIRQTFIENSRGIAIVPPSAKDPLRMLSRHRVGNIDLLLDRTIVRQNQTSPISPTNNGLSGMASPAVPFESKSPNDVSRMFAAPPPSRSFNGGINLVEQWLRDIDIRMNNMT